MMKETRIYIIDKFKKSKLFLHDIDCWSYNENFIFTIYFTTLDSCFDGDLCYVCYINASGYVFVGNLGAHADIMSSFLNYANSDGSSPTIIEYLDYYENNKNIPTVYNDYKNLNYIEHGSLNDIYDESIDYLINASKNEWH